MTYVIQINVKYVFLKTFKPIGFFLYILYIPGGGDHERIPLTVDL